MVSWYILLRFSVLQHLGQDPHVLDAPGLVKPGPQNHSIEPEVIPLDGPALHGPVGFLVEPADPLGVGEDLSGPNSGHVWNGK